MNLIIDSCKMSVCFRVPRSNFYKQRKQRSRAGKEKCRFLCTITIWTESPESPDINTHTPSSYLPVCFDEAGEVGTLLSHEVMHVFSFANTSAAYLQIFASEQKCYLLR